ncbi:MAG: group III truncated hemoglobin [Imperialibacter sp.]|uniref:group III truncated hemoglobin n=1 Tax=Imperialibacter sp. TaxID=2038411 RepID=UPI0030DAECDF|tara:strand:+ start:5035 stop:5412 length:378 start_codon:yes stop_codon:yes gene_type:complete
MKQDIASRSDIEKLVDQFYSKVRTDGTIGYIFTDIAALDFARHMPTMYKFWETTLLGIMSYKGNPMSVHIQLDKKEQLKKEHFDRWLELWTATVDDLFEGPKAEEAKTRASQIRYLMQYKVEQSR